MATGGSALPNGLCRLADLERYNHLWAHYAQLDSPESYQAEYVWIDAFLGTRSKTRTLPLPVAKHPSELPEWNYDGSSTGQAPGHDSEVIMKPVAIFRDPFRRGNNILVMCDTWDPQGRPLPTNTRHSCAKVMEQVRDAEDPWFGIEQEYTLLDMDHWPLGWPKGGYPGPQGPYYCAAGADVSFGRTVVECHYRACLYAGIKIAGINAEVMPGQWEFQVGICKGVEVGDHLWMSRFIMHRVCEEHGVIVSFDPKPVPGDWNGAGAHTNYSTNSTRKAETGFAKILEMLELMGKRHKEHIAAYGAGNERRLTGAHETAPIDKFSYGVANRGASCRIPRDTEKNKSGYFEDRRPASNIDPWVVSERIVRTTILNE